MTIIKNIISRIVLWRAKNEAKRKHNENGKQYHVIPVNINKGKGELMVVNNLTIKDLNNKLPKSQKLTMDKVYKMSLYTTPSKSPFSK